MSLLLHSAAKAQQQPITASSRGVFFSQLGEDIDPWNPGEESPGGLLEGCQGILLVVAPLKAVAFLITW